MKVLVAIALAVFVSLGSTPSSAAEPSAGDDGAFVPASWSVDSTGYWVVGFAFERSGDNFVGRNVLADQLYGVGMGYRYRPIGIHSRLMFSPREELEGTRLLAGMTLRAYVDLLGVEFAYGTGIQADLRLEEGFWVASATPAELSAVIFDRGSWRVQLAVGISRIFAGDVVDSFLVDPNGFQSDSVRQQLNCGLRDGPHASDCGSLAPWQGLLNLTFARRVD